MIITQPQEVHVYMYIHYKVILLINSKNYLENPNEGFEVFRDSYNLVNASLLTALSFGCLGSKLSICSVALGFFVFPTAYVKVHARDTPEGPPFKILSHVLKSKAMLEL